jgi:hypothetical protein
MYTTATCEPPLVTVTLEFGISCVIVYAPIAEPLLAMALGTVLKLNAPEAGA